MWAKPQGSKWPCGLFLVASPAQPRHGGLSPPPCTALCVTGPAPVSPPGFGGRLLLRFKREYIFFIALVRPAVRPLARPGLSHLVRRRVDRDRGGSPRGGPGRARGHVCEPRIALCSGPPLGKGRTWLVSAMACLLPPIAFWQRDARYFVTSSRFPRRKVLLFASDGVAEELQPSGSSAGSLHISGGTSPPQRGECRSRFASKGYDVFVPFVPPLTRLVTRCPPSLVEY